jgi:catalase-peroxidase
MQYLQNLFNFEWVQTRSPGGGVQWVPKNADEVKFVPDAHVAGKRHAPIMFTTDLSLKFDPAYREISMRFKDNPEQFEAAFAKAWFKLTHRDMGPRARYVGSDVPSEVLSWQDPIPAVEHRLISQRDARKLKRDILDTELTVPELVRAAWASAASYRDTDMRGGTNGARVALAPQKSWPANNPQELAKVLEVLEAIQTEFNDSRLFNKRVSLADMIVLGGAAAIEEAARRAGMDIEVPFTPGRGDATPEQTDVASFTELEPKADAFRNYYSNEARLSPVHALVDRANLLGLNVPETTVLLGGMRVLGANTDGAEHGVFTDRVGTLSTDFFVNLLDMGTVWQPSTKAPYLYDGRDRASGELRWTATPVDLLVGSHSELRAIAEVYGANDGQQRFVQDFVDAWVKVMNQGRFDRV